MTLIARVEQVLRGQADSDRKPRIGHVGLFDGCVVRPQPDGSVIVRSGPSELAAQTEEAGHLTTRASGLEACARVLGEAGFLVQRARDRHGHYVKVTAGPNIASDS
jgi:hypothetical protein